MARKPKTGPPKKAPVPKITKEEQSERFIQTARELGVDESGKEFERAIAALIRRRDGG